jgi:hypothetical protein
MPGREVLRAIAAEKIRNGSLSRADPVHVERRLGADHACRLCEGPIASHEVEVEAWLDAATRYHFHVACHRAWKSERKRD